MPFGTEKLEWCGYPMVKNFDDMFIVLTESTNVTDTDRQTPHDDIGRACTASCCKNENTASTVIVSLPVCDTQHPL